MLGVPMVMARSFLNRLLLAPEFGSMFFWRILSFSLLEVVAKLSSAVLTGSGFL